MEKIDSKNIKLKEGDIWEHPNGKLSIELNEIDGASVWGLVITIQVGDDYIIDTYEDVEIGDVQELKHPENIMIKFAVTRVIDSKEAVFKIWGQV